MWRQDWSRLLGHWLPSVILRAMCKKHICVIEAHVWAVNWIAWWRRFVKCLKILRGSIQMRCQRDSYMRMVCCYLLIDFKNRFQFVRFLHIHHETDTRLFGLLNQTKEMLTCHPLAHRETNLRKVD